MVLRTGLQRLTTEHQTAIALVLDGQLKNATKITSLFKAASEDREKRLDLERVQRDENVNRIMTSVSDLHTVCLSRMDDNEQHSLRRRLLDALAFPDMNDRQNQIERLVGDFGDTFQWIFDDFDQNRFPAWLQEGSGVFWICGKAGSGKSSLMDLIARNIEDGGLFFDLLKQWAGTETPGLLTFWFYRPSPNELIKSTSGLWRSLCFQILNQEPNLSKKIRENSDGKVPEKLKTSLIASGSCVQSWSDSQLKSWLEYLLTHCDSKYCLLIDGLDEVGESALEAVKEVSRMSSHVKICCSSRPESSFHDALQESPSLLLEERNATDIASYCNRRLEGTRAADHCDSIASRAQGVFLWAHLVTEVLREAAKRGDDENELEERLKICPDGMTELFTHLLERQDKFYLKYPKPYLKLIDVAVRRKSCWAIPDLPVLVLHLASQNQHELLEAISDGSGSDFFTKLDQNTRFPELKTIVVTRCAGLIEMTPDEFVRDPHRHDHNASRNRRYRQLEVTHNFKVRFTHRSALSFLQEDPQAASFLASSGVSEDEATTRLLNASVAKAILGEDLGDRIVLPEEPFQFASAISGEAWSEQVTSVMDRLFANAETRTEWSISERPIDVLYTRCWKREFIWFRDPLVPSEIFMSSPKLSNFENMAFCFGSIYALQPYIREKLLKVDSDLKALAAALSYCQHLRSAWYSKDFLTVLEPCLEVERMIYFEYHWSTSSAAKVICATRPLWEHIFCASISWFHISWFQAEGWNKIKKDVQSRVPALCPPLQPNGPSVELWMIGGRESSKRFILPPDSGVLDSEMLEERVFKVQMCVGCVESQGHSALKFLEWSPSGIGRFLLLTDGQNESLRQGFDRGLHEDYEHTLLAILKNNWSSLSLQEKAKAIWYGESLGRRYIFVAGEVLSVDADERNTWEDSLFELGVIRGIPAEDSVTEELIEIIVNDGGAFERLYGQSETNWYGLER